MLGGGLTGGFALDVQQLIIYPQVLRPDKLVNGTRLKYRTFVAVTDKQTHAINTRIYRKYFMVLIKSPEPFTTKKRNSKVNYCLFDEN